MRQPHIVNEYIDGQSLKDFLIREIHLISLTRRVKMVSERPKYFGKMLYGKLFVKIFV